MSPFIKDEIQRLPSPLQTLPIELVEVNTRGINNIKESFHAQTWECVSFPTQKKQFKVVNLHRNDIKQVNVIIPNLVFMKLGLESSTTWWMELNRNQVKAFTKYMLLNNTYQVMPTNKVGEMFSPRGYPIGCVIPTSPIS